MSFPNLPGHPDLAGLPNSLGPVEPVEREALNRRFGRSRDSEDAPCGADQNSGEAKHYARTLPIASTRGGCEATNPL
jgi:hypothetical protein